MLMHHASKNETCHAEGCPGLLLWCIFNMAAVQHFYHSTKDFLTISLVQVASAWTAVAVANYTLPGISLISSPASSCQLFCCVYFVMCFITLRFKSRINFTVCFALLRHFLNCLLKIKSYWASLSECLVSLFKWRYIAFRSRNNLTIRSGLRLIFSTNSVKQTLIRPLVEWEIGLVLSSSVTFTVNLVS